MGEMYDAICNGCETKFDVSEGSGMFAMPFHCDQCGATWVWVFDPDQGGGTFIEDEEPGSPSKAPPESSQQEQPRDVWSLLAEKPQPPPCECGGTFKSGAPPRCPKCRSADFRRDPLGHTILYD